MTKSAIESLKSKTVFERHHIDLISRLYFNGMIGIKDQDIFPAEKYEPFDVGISISSQKFQRKKLNSFLKKY